MFKYFPTNYVHCELGGRDACRPQSAFMSVGRRELLGLGALTLAFGTHAEGSWPGRPVKFIVPQSPGGPSDIVARLLADAMRASLGQTIVVDNRPGAAGMIGTAAVVNAPADGYSVLVTSRTNHVMAPLVQRGGQVEPARDLLPVGLLLKAVGMLVTNRQSGFRSLKDLVQFAKAHPGRLNYGSAGIGATNHIAVEQFKEIAGIDMAHIPYKGGGPLVTALMAGEVQFALLDFSSAQTGRQAGSVVALAQTGSKRLAALADVPTLAQEGFSRYDPSFWVGLAVPKGTHADIIQKLNASMNEALSQTRVKAYAQANGWELAGGGPKALSDLVAQDYLEFPALVRRLDIKPS